MDANLIVTFDPAHSGKAKEEVKAALNVEDSSFSKSGVEGLFLLKVDNAKEAVKKLRDDPSKFEYTFHWVPIDKWCSSKMDSMLKEMEEIDKKMNPDESWKMDLGKRQYEGKTTDLIMKLTEKIDKPKVDLKNPQKIVKVEIIGKNAGIALLDAEELLEVPKLKGK